MNFSTLSAAALIAAIVVIPSYPRSTRVSTRALPKLNQYRTLDDW